MSGETTTLWDGMIRLPRRLFGQASDIVRVFELALLYLAALYLPKSWALVFADAAGSLISLSPLGGRTRQWMRSTFPAAEDTDKLAREWLRRPFRDHVVVTRIAENRETADQWRVEQRNPPAILREPGKSVLIVIGHFSRQAVAAVFSPLACPKKLVSVVAPVEQGTHDARALRIRVQLGEMVKAIRRLRNDDVEVVEVSGRSVATRLLHSLREPDKVMIISADVPWPKGRSAGHERPFAGHSSQNFALGGARLSRLAQCPIVMCVPFLDGDRIVLEWSDPLMPAAAGDADSDVRVTNEMLDTIERAVGERPGQYVLAVGHDRYWDPKTGTWQMPVAETVAAPAPAKAAEAATIV
ncbi:lysophospholipid acyltransferase family protein [Terricaulis silvestris]|uniref:Lauroyl/myristoyl acyltransferase n=1 Tax=Terricaulis silvestris TaxID=2686094 RepID=A0A6I6MSG4_9CAUL|nr:hypothetical protein [Terricaulis silvestris]QGZ97091.1 Lauroyl/myristoyl acyltransferase [Terricaulis silvestris]